MRPRPRQGEIWLAGDAPGWWHGARHAYDGAIRASASLGVSRVLAAAGGTGRLVHVLHGGCPPARLVATLIGGDRPLAEWTAIARDISALRYRNRATLSLVARGGSRVLDLLLDPDAAGAVERISRPAIVLWWHLGPSHGLSAAILRSGVPALEIVRAKVSRREPGLDVAQAGGPREQALAFARAVTRLREGGLVVVAADGQQGALTAPVPCLGRSVQLARGPFALARLTGAPLVPAVARWTSSRRIEVVVGDAILTPARRDAADTDSEGAAAAPAAGWFEQYVRHSPGELWFRTMWWLLEAPVRAAAV